MDPFQDPRFAKRALAHTRLRVSDGSVLHRVEPSDLQGSIQPEVASKLIRRIFAAGLQLTALQSLLGDGILGDKAASVVRELDAVIQDIRSGVSIR